MKTPATSITEIAKLGARDRRLISSYRGRETKVQPEPDKLSALIDAVRALVSIDKQTTEEETQHTGLPPRRAR